MFTESAEMIPKVSKNVLRPETIESFFYMWRTTGDVKYRQWGWTVFQAFQTYSRTPEGAFAAVKVSRSWWITAKGSCHRYQIRGELVLCMLPLP